MSSLAPIRQELKEAAVVPKGPLTVRQAVEWFKKTYYAGFDLEVLAEHESQFLNQQYVKVIEKTIPDENLPSGPLAQMVSAVALQEIVTSAIPEEVR